MRIFIVDDNKSFRGKLRFFIEVYLNYEVIGEAGDGHSFLQSNIDAAEIILMDIHMPNMNGLDATETITRERESSKIIAVSQYEEIVDFNLLMNIGFKGFVSKTNLFEDLPKALTAVSQGEFFFPVNTS